MLLAAAIMAIGPTGLTAAEQQVAAAGFPATLVEPSDPDALVLMLISGSGPTDRDGNSRLGVSASYLSKLATKLGEHGIGSLRFDKRGVPGSQPVEREADVTMATFADDAKAVLDWLERRSDQRPVILVGHSEGGLVALAVAGRRPEIAGLVLVATPGLPPADTLRAQLQTLEEPLRSQALAIEREIEDGREVETMPDSLLPLFRPSVQPFLRSLFAMRPAEELATLRMPVLVIGGGTDLQVGRADFDALAAAGPDVESRWFNSMNHVLVDAPADRSANLATYWDASLPLTDGLSDAIAEFARRR
jgi:pimeloyl-ACP methyl ester carboxylesterase